VRFRSLPFAAAKQTIPQTDRMLPLPDRNILAESLRHGLLAEDSLADLVRLLQQYKVAGGSQQEAVDALEHLRMTAEAPHDDKILELLDFVTGFCAPSHAIW
jgi:hypothetical protein